MIKDGVFWADDKDEVNLAATPSAEAPDGPGRLHPALHWSEYVPHLQPNALLVLRERCKASLDPENCEKYVRRYVEEGVRS